MVYEPNFKRVSGSVPVPPVTLTGRSVLDERSTKVGKVTDVLFDDRDWAVVKTGTLSGEHLVPLEHTYLDADGRLVVPLDKGDIKHAPRIGRDHVLTPSTRAQLRDYYGLAA